MRNSEHAAMTAMPAGKEFGGSASGYSLGQVLCGPPINHSALRPVRSNDQGSCSRAPLDTLPAVFEPTVSPFCDYVGKRISF